MSTEPQEPVIVDEPPDDDVAIGESPDGDRLSGDQARQLLTTRRGLLVSLGTLGAIAAIAEGDLAGGGDQGNIYGGTMALDKAYKIGPRTYLGPDSAKSNVLSEIPDDEGWVYQAADTDVDYYLDNNAWNLRSIGSSGTKVPEGHIQSGFIDDLRNAGRDLSQIEEITSDGVWTWWHEPRAVYSNGSTFTGYINQAGDAVAAAFNHSLSGAVSTTTLNSNFQDDDHDNPAVLVASDGRLWYFYSKHGDETQFYYRVSSSAGDISTFDAEQTVTTPTAVVTYPSPIQFDNGDIRVYHREGGSYEFVTTTDGGSTWSGPTELWDSATYTKVRPIGNDVGFGITTNAGGPSVGDTGIAYVRYDRSANAYLDAAGNDLGALPIDDTALNQIWDASSTGERAWMWDINYDSNNNPVLLFATFPSIGHHVYRHAEWKDGSWDVTKVCDAGTYIANSNQDYYSAGACLDDSDPSVVYAGVGGPRGSAIQRWEKTGSTWEYQTVVGAQSHNCRPISPRNAHDDLRLMWLRGPYRHWQYGSYETGVVGSDGSQTVSVDMPTTPVLYDRACRLSTSSESLASGSYTNINWSTEHRDRGGFWDSGQANNYDVFIPAWGEYNVTVRVELSALSAAATVDLQLFEGVKTLGSHIQLDQTEASSGAAPVLSGSATIMANADRPMSGGRVIARVQHDSGGAESLSNAEIEVTQVAP